MGTGFSLTQSIRRSATLTPDATATIDGPRVRTHAMFVERVARFAGCLQSLGMQPGDRVSALALNSDRFLEYYMGTWWAGGLAAPLNIRWTNEEMARALRLAGSSVLVVDKTFAPRVADIREAAPCVREVIGIDLDTAQYLDYETLMTNSMAVEDLGRRGRDAACLLFTGGTTGTPKAVELSHESLVAAGIAMRAMGCGTKDRLLHAPPLFHMGGLQMALCHWLGGGTHVLIPSFDPAAVARAIREQAVTDVLLAPTMIEMFLSQAELVAEDLRSLRQIFYGTSPMTPALLARAMEVIPGATFVQGYGMTETAMTVMLGPEHHSEEGRKLGRLSSIGTPSPFAEVRIVSPDGTDLGRDQPGELWVRGPSVMSGYWRMPEETAAAFSDGWLKTGDGAFLDSGGFIHLTDRIKDMIITGGENVFSVEVEKVVATHPAVSAVAVIGVPHPQWGEQVHAVVVPTPGMDVAVADLVDFCRQRLAGYKVPRSISFLDELPLSAAGKVLKTELRQLMRDFTDADNPGDALASRR